MTPTLACNGSRILYSPIPESRYDEVVRFVGKYFYAADAVCKELKLFPDGVLTPLAHSTYRKRVEYGASFCAIDELTQEIVGVAMNSRVSESLDKAFGDFFQHSYAMEPNKWGPFLTFQTARTKGTSLREFLGFHNIFEIGEVAVKPEYSRRGIASELSRMSVDLGRQGDYDALTVSVTSPATMKIFSQLGFQVVQEFRLCNMTHDGKPLSDNPELYSTRLVLPLQSY